MSFAWQMIFTWIAVAGAVLLALAWRGTPFIAALQP